MHKLCILLLVLIVIFIGCEKNEKVDLERAISTKIIYSIKSPLLFNFKLHTLNRGETFIGFDRYENALIEFDRNGDILRSNGNSGKGPGEFEFVENEFYKNSIYILDYELSRISVFDKELQFISTIPIKHKKINDIIEYNNSLFLLGHFPHKNNDNGYFINEFELCKELIIDNGSYIEGPNHIDIKFLKGIETYFSDSVIGEVKGKSLILVSCYLDKFVQFDLESKEYKLIGDLKFPGYIPPDKIKFAKLVKENRKLKISESYFAFYPVDIINTGNAFVVQFIVPYQFKEALGKIITVEYDENLKFKTMIDLDELILTSFYRNSKLFFLTTIYYEHLLGEQQPDEIYLNEREWLR